MFNTMLRLSSIGISGVAASVTMLRYDPSNRINSSLKLDNNPSSVSKYLSLAPEDAISPQSFSDPVRPNRDVWLIAKKNVRMNLTKQRGQDIDTKDDKPVPFGIQRFEAACKRRGLRLRVLSAYDVDVELKNDDISLNKVQRLSSKYLKESRHGAQKKKKILKNGNNDSANGNDMTFNNKLPLFAIARTGSSSRFRELTFYRVLENLGVPVVNCPLSIEYCSNKFLTYSVLAANEIEIPHTVLVDAEHQEKDKNIDSKQILKTHGLKLPLVLKIIGTCGGDGVFLVHTEKELDQLLRMAIFFQPDAKMIVQECVVNSYGKDMRVWVAGDKVVGWVLRKNDNKDEFRSNIHAGGKPHHIELSDDVKKIAVEASLALGLDFSGVDFLFNGIDPKTGKESYKIAEVNSSPGWDPYVEEWCDFDLAESVLDHVCEKYNIPVQCVD